MLTVHMVHGFGVAESNNLAYTYSFNLFCLQSEQIAFVGKGRKAEVIFLMLIRS